MAFTFWIDLNAVKALELFAGDQDVRYYLNGIEATALDPHTVRLRATDGHCAAEHRIKTETPMEGEFPQSGIIPRGAFKGMKSPGNSVYVTIEPGVSGTRDAPGIPPGYSINGERIGKLIDGKFPDVDRVWPKKVCMRAAHIDPDLIARVGEAADLLAGKRSTLNGVIYQNGADGPSLFRVRQDFIGLLMPMRIELDKIDLPDWCPSTISQDAHALESIQRLLSGHEWDSETVERVAEIVADYGYPIAESEVA